MSGQLADGITTPIVGYLSDKLDLPCGKRNAWYFIGTIIVAPSFLCMFIGVDGFQSEAGKNLWYLAWPAIFNVGWAAVQIAHMAIINSLSFS